MELFKAQLVVAFLLFDDITKMISKNPSITVTLKTGNTRRVRNQVTGEIYAEDVLDSYETEGPSNLGSCIKPAKNIVKIKIDCPNPKRKNPFEGLFGD